MKRRCLLFFVSIALATGVALAFLLPRLLEDRSLQKQTPSTPSSYAIAVQAGVFLIFGDVAASEGDSCEILPAFDRSLIDLVWEDSDAKKSERISFISSSGNHYVVLKEHHDGAVSSNLYLVGHRDLEPEHKGQPLRSDFWFQLDIRLSAADPAQEAVEAVESDLSMRIVAIEIATDYGDYYDSDRGVPILEHLCSCAIDLVADGDVTYRDSEEGLVDFLMDALSEQPTEISAGQLYFDGKPVLDLGSIRVKLVKRYARKRIKQANGVEGVFIATPDLEAHVIAIPEQAYSFATVGSSTDTEEVSVARVRIGKFDLSSTSVTRQTELVVRRTKLLDTTGQVQARRTDVFAPNPNSRLPFVELSTLLPIDQSLQQDVHLDHNLQTPSVVSFGALLDSAAARSGYLPLHVVDERPSDRSMTWKHYSGDAKAELVAVLEERESPDGYLERTWQDAAGTVIAVQVWEGKAGVGCRGMPKRACYATGGEDSILFDRNYGFRQLDTWRDYDHVSLEAIDIGACELLIRDEGEESGKGIPAVALRLWAGLWDIVSRTFRTGEESVAPPFRAETCETELVHGYRVVYREVGDGSGKLGFVGRVAPDGEGTVELCFYYSREQSKLLLWESFGDYSYSLDCGLGLDAPEDAARTRTRWGHVYLPESSFADLDLEDLLEWWHDDLARRKRLKEALEETENR